MTYHQIGTESEEDAKAVHEFTQRLFKYLFIEMKKQGMNRYQLAKKTGISEGYLSHIVTGRRRLNLRTMGILLDALDMEMNLYSYASGNTYEI